MYKATAGKWTVFAFDRTDNSPKTGDAGNITANIRIDGGSADAVDDTNPTELEDGYYVFDLTAAETNGDHLVLCPQSSTGNIQVIGVPGAQWTRERESLHEAGNTIYVSKSGSDSNDGSSWELAKLTVTSAVAAAASNDTIMIGAGDFEESAQVDASALTGLRILGTGFGSIISRSSGSPLKIGDYTLVQNLRIETDRTLSAYGLDAGSKTGVTIDNCFIAGGSNALYAIGSAFLVARNSYFVAGYDGAQMQNATGWVLENCILRTYADYTSTPTHFNGLAADSGSKGVARGCTILGTRNDSTNYETRGVRLGGSGNCVLLDGCAIHASQISSGAGDVIGVKMDTGGTCFVKNCLITTSSVGGYSYDFEQTGGTLSIASTSYDTSKVTGTVTNVDGASALRELVATHSGVSGSLADVVADILDDTSTGVPAILSNTAHGGAAATLTLSQLIVAPSSGNTDGVSFSGFGTGKGLIITGGSDGEGMVVDAGGGNNAGLLCQGQGTGQGIKTLGGTSGSGIYAEGGTNYSGLQLVGQGTGQGLKATGGSGGSGIYAQGGTNYHGMQLVGIGAGQGLRCTASGTGAGIYAAGGTNQPGANFAGNGTGAGLRCSGGATGPGIYAYAQGTAYAGVLFVGAGTGAGMHCTGGSAGGPGIWANGQSNGPGARLAGNGSGSGMECTGATTGHGIYATGGSTSGNGILCSVTSGYGIDAGAGDTIRGNVALTSTTIAAVGVEVNAELEYYFETNTIAEPGQESWDTTASLADKIGRLDKVLVNKSTQSDAGAWSLYNHAGDTVDQKATMSDAAGVTTKGLITTGP